MSDLHEADAGEAASHNDGPPETDSDATDPVFGFIAGVYAGALLAPAVTILASLGLTDDPASLFFSFLGSVISFAMLVGWIARRESVGPRVGRSQWVWLAVVAPFGYGAVMLGGIAAGFRGAFVGASMAGMIAGMVTGMGFAVAARNRYARAALAESEEYVRFDARAPERDRRFHYAGIALLATVAIAGPVLAALTDVDAGRDLFVYLLPFLGGLLGLTSERTYAVTDAGLLADQGVFKNLRAWDQFERFSVTDDAVVVHRAGWSAFGLRDVRRDATDLEDVEAVDDALAKFLPRK